MAAHLVLITARVHPGTKPDALRNFEAMYPVIHRLAPGLARSIFFESVEDPAIVGCVCVWTSREEFLRAADDPTYQRTVSGYFASPIFVGPPGHTAYDVLFDRSE